MAPLRDLDFVFASDCGLDSRGVNSSSCVERALGDRPGDADGELREGERFEGEDVKGGTQFSGDDFGEDTLDRDDIRLRESQEVFSFS